MAKILLSHPASLAHQLWFFQFYDSKKLSRGGALSEFDWFLFCHMIDFFGYRSLEIEAQHKKERKPNENQNCIETGS